MTYVREILVYLSAKGAAFKQEQARRERAREGAREEAGERVRCEEAREEAPVLDNLELLMSEVL